MAAIIEKLAGWLARSSRRPGRPGRLSKRRIRGFLPADAVIIEAGAHVGHDTVELSRLWPEGRIHAFEPLPDLFATLKARTGDRPNVRCYPLALGGTSGRVEFNVSSGTSDASSSILAPKQHLEQHPEVTFDRTIVVEAITIDDWARRQGVRRVDFLWLDLQGYELFTLKSAGTILPAVRAIYTEVYLKESYRGVPLYPEVRDWLGRRGFTVEWEGLPWPDAGNVLFVRR